MPLLPLGVQRGTTISKLLLLLPQLPLLRWPPLLSLLLLVVLLLLLLRRRRRRLGLGLLLELLLQLRLPDPAHRPLGAGPGSGATGGSRGDACGLAMTPLGAVLFPPPLG